MFRFFTVYGPWGRPDMAPFKFVDAILNDRAIDIYNHGQMSARLHLCRRSRRKRRAADRLRSRARSRRRYVSPVAPFRVVNIGRGTPVQLLDFIETIERALGNKAKRNYLDMQPGDVPRTFAERRPPGAPDRLSPAYVARSRESRRSSNGIATIAALMENCRIDRRQPLDALRRGLPLVAVGARARSAACLLLLVG